MLDREVISRRNLPHRYAKQHRKNAREKVRDQQRAAAEQAEFEAENPELFRKKRKKKLEKEATE